MYDGYVRGCGLKYGNIRDLCNDDDVFSGAMTLAMSEAPNGKKSNNRHPLNFMNIFAIIKLNLSHLRDVGHIRIWQFERWVRNLFCPCSQSIFFPARRLFHLIHLPGFPATKPEIDAYRGGSFEAVDLT